MESIGNNLGEASNNFGRELKELRISKSMSLRDVELLSGVSASYLWRLETGDKRAPTIPILTKLAVVYKINPIELLKIALGEEIYTEKTTVRGLLLSHNIIANDTTINDEIKFELANIVDIILETLWDRDQEFKLLRKVDSIKKLLI